MVSESDPDSIYVWLKIHVYSPVAEPHSLMEKVA